MKNKLFGWAQAIGSTYFVWRVLVPREPDWWEWVLLPVALAAGLVWSLGASVSLLAEVLKASTDPKDHQPT